jgi:replication initiation and membrane attachment protein DnaB
VRKRAMMTRNTVLEEQMTMAAKKWLYALIDQLVITINGVKDIAQKTVMQFRKIHVRLIPSTDAIKPQIVRINLRTKTESTAMNNNVH